MKTATYKLLDGTEKTIDYDENAPCVNCGEPVVEASMGGTALCPWCDCGRCRYCGVDLPIGTDAINNHMGWHRAQIEAIAERERQASL